MRFFLFVFLLTLFGISESYATIASDTILLGDYPYAITLDDQNKAYVLNLRVNTFSIQIIANNTIIDQMQFNRDYGQPGFIQIDSSKNLAYVGNISNPSISVIDLQTKSLIKNIDLEYCEKSSMNDLQLDTKTNRLYFSIVGINIEDGCDKQKYDSIGIIDTDTDKVIDEIKELNPIDSIFFNHQKNLIYVMPTFGFKILTVNLEQNNTINLIDFGDGLPLEHAYDEESKLIFTGFGNGTIAIINSEKLVLEKAIQIPNYKESQQFRLIDGNGQLFIILDEYYSGDISSKNAHLLIYTISEDSFSNLIQVGQRPLENVFDENLNLLYTLNLISESISVVDIEKKKVIDTIESFRFEIVSIIIFVFSIILLIIIKIKHSSKKRIWLLSGLGAILGVYVPWAYPFFMRVESSVFISEIKMSFSIWPIAVAMPLAISICYVIFLFSRFDDLREKISEAYYFPKDLITEMLYDSKKGFALSLLIALLTSFLIYEMVNHITLQAFFDALPISEIMRTIPLSEIESSATANTFFNESSILKIILAGAGAIWVIILRRIWTAEWNIIQKFEEKITEYSIFTVPEMKFKGSRSLLIFLVFSLVFYSGIFFTSLESEETLQSWERPQSSYSISHFISFILPTTLIFFFFERLLFENFLNKEERPL